MGVMTMKDEIRRAILPLILLSGFAVAPPAWSVEAPPDVPVVVLRLGYPTPTFKHAYRFTQPYRKTLAAPPLVQVADVLVEFVSPSDFGHTEVRSRLTGQKVFRATSVWAGLGRFEWPTAAEEVTGVTRGAPAPEPAAFSRWTNLTETQARAAWESARDIDLVKEIAQAGPYGVFAYIHRYEPNFGPFEWIFIVYGRPPAPPDAGVIDLVWPRTLITQDVAATPEVRVHNFGDEPIDADVEVEFRDQDEVVHTSRRSVQGLPPDASSLLTFASVTWGDAAPLTYEARILTPGGSSWSDTFADNDALERAIQTTVLPVFRVVSSKSRPGPIPLSGEMADFDGDGDMDVIQHLFTPVFQQNDGTGLYANIASRIQASLSSHSRRAHVHDFDGDLIPDVLIQYFQKAPILLHGDGTGGFTDVTPASGLSSHTSSRGLTVLDLDGDNDLDILLLAATNTPLLNDGTGRFSIAPATGLEDGSGQILGIARGDLGGDAFPDLVMVNFNTAPAVMRNLGGGLYQQAATLAAGIRGYNGAILDHDADSDMDILINSVYGDRLFRQVGPFQFEEVTAQAGPLGGSFSAAVHDFDGDGWGDLVNDDLRLLRNNAGTFIDATDHLVEVAAHYQQVSTVIPVQFIDFDGDGDRDIYYQHVALENLGLPLRVLAVAIDIKPGDAVNSVNPSAHGILRVLLFGATDLDVRAVDASTLAFGPAGAASAHEGRRGPRIADLNGDALEDLDLRFWTHETGIAHGDRTACLTGIMNDGTPIEGCDVVTTVRRSRSPLSRTQP